MEYQTVTRLLSRTTNKLFWNMVMMNFWKTIRKKTLWKMLIPKLWDWGESIWFSGKMTTWNLRKSCIQWKWQIMCFLIGRIIGQVWHSWNICKKIIWKTFYCTQRSMVWGCKIYGKPWYPQQDWIEVKVDNDLFQVQCLIFSASGKAW